MSNAKILRYELVFENELSSQNGAVVKDVKVSSDNGVDHRIRGYYDRPTSPANIRVLFDCRHPGHGIANYRNDDGMAEQQWTGEIQVDGIVRTSSAMPIFRSLIVAEPPQNMDAVIECYFKVTKRWSRKEADWMPEIYDYSRSCELVYKVMP